MNIETYRDAVLEHDENLANLVSKNIKLIPDFAFENKRRKDGMSHEDRVWSILYSELANLTPFEDIMTLLNDGGVSFRTKDVIALRQFVDSFPTILWLTLMEQSRVNDDDYAAFRLLIAADRIDLLDDGISLLTNGHEKLDNFEEDFLHQSMVFPQNLTLSILGELNSILQANSLYDYYEVPLTNPDQKTTRLYGGNIDAIVESGDYPGIIYYYIVVSDGTDNAIRLIINNRLNGRYDINDRVVSDFTDYNMYEGDITTNQYVWSDFLALAIVYDLVDVVKTILEANPKGTIDQDNAYLLRPVLSVVTAQVLVADGRYDWANDWFSHGLLIPTIETIRYVMSDAVRGSFGDDWNGNTWVDILRCWLQWNNPSILSHIEDLLNEPGFQVDIRDEYDTNHNVWNDLYYYILHSDGTREPIEELKLLIKAGITPPFDYITLRDLIRADKRLMTITIINATKVYPSFRTILSRELLNMVIDRKDKELVEVLINSGRFTEEAVETIKNTIAYKELYDTNK